MIKVTVERSRRGAGAAGRGGLEPLTPQRKWQTITIATVLLVPAYWALLAGLVSEGSDGTTKTEGPNVAAALALGIAIVPFVFIVLAFMSGHPRAPGAVVRAMMWAVLVGIPVSALAGDAVTGIVAGVGAGGIVALRMDDAHTVKSRAAGVAIAAVYTFVLIRTAGVITLLPAPVFPLTAIGLADLWAERQAARAAG
jgi:hypothetical protein